MRWWVVVAALAAWGCDDEPREEAVDAAVIDGAPSDAGGGEEAGDDAMADAGALDAGAMDAGADARVPQMPDEWPTDGPATLPGPDDLTAAIPLGQARAGRVDAAEEALTGPDAQCRPGCFRLDNAFISVCIQGETTFSQITFQGGNIIDAYPAGAHGTDRLREVVFAPGLGEVSVERIGIVRDGLDGGPAVLRTVGRAGGGRTIQAYLPNGALPPPIKVTTEYRLEPDARHVDVLTWFDAEDRGGAFLAADMVIFGDRNTAFFPEGPPDAPPGGIMPFLAATSEAVAYGWSSADAPTISVLNIPIDAFPLRPVTHGQIGVFPGDVVLQRRRFHVGPDVESMRDTPEAWPTVRFLGPPGAWIDVDDEARQITRLRLDAEGQREARLQPGAYRARPLDWPGGEIEPVVFAAMEGAEVVLELPPPARLRISVRDDLGAGIGAKVVLTGGGEERIEFVLDDGALEIEAGEWRMVTSRGWHYTVDDRMITLLPGEALEEAVVLTEVIPFDGLSAGEFHQHSTLSLDSEVPNRRRILSNIAEGVGFMVPSDHDVLFDFASLAVTMGVLDRVALPLPGVEVSPIFTHLGAYGVRYDAEAGAGGAPPLPIREDDAWRVRTVPELIASARALGAEIIQVNHPRDSSGFFDTVRYRADTAVGELDSPHWTPEFDSVEVYNGQGDFCAVFADWMGLLNQGLRITAVGNSDTHGEGKAPGFPRNYLPTAAAVAHEVTRAEVVAGLREGRVIVGGGAVLDFPEGPAPGDTVDAVDGQVVLQPRLRTPPYTRISRLLAFHNGRAVADVAVEPELEAILDFEGAVPVPIDADGPVVLLALGTPNMPYIAGGPVFALANPIWVDADGDGQVTPPGPAAIELPEMTICR